MEDEEEEREGRIEEEEREGRGKVGWRGEEPSR